MAVFILHFIKIVLNRLRREVVLFVKYSLSFYYGEM